MGNVERISLSFTKFLLEEIDEIVELKGYSSRSELIRDATRKQIIENNQFNKGDVLSGIIIIVYSPKKNSLEYMSNIYFEYNAIVKSMNQSYISTSCGLNKKIELFIVEGDSKTLSEFYLKISKIDGKVYDKVILF